MRTRLFIDFWNFQLNWNDRAGDRYQIDWRAAPSWASFELYDLIDKLKR